MVSANAEPFQERLGGRIALVTEIDLWASRLVAYNLHLESRGNNNLRISQLNEVIEDVATYDPQIPTLVAGDDLNLDVSRVFPAFASLGSGFRNALGARAQRTTPSRGILGHPRSLDWAFVSGSLDRIGTRPPDSRRFRSLSNFVYAPVHLIYPYTSRC